MITLLITDDAVNGKVLDSGLCKNYWIALLVFVKKLTHEINPFHVSKKKKKQKKL